jgi:hypothetical protein
MIELSENCKQWMKTLGHFGPTVNVADKLIKGSLYDFEEGGCFKSYLSASDLWELSNACQEMAKWLETRAKEVGAKHTTDTPAPPSNDS